MSSLAISSQGLSKEYKIGLRQERYSTLRDSLTRMATGPFRALQERGKARRKRHEETIWAIKDVSFDVPVGQVVGIIGRNGAGKSTLLKVLSRITEPTLGQAEIYGRVGSLLEVGTGFHPELTGRENIYLNGAILGMGRADIDRKLDEIIQFAEVEKFVDTAVKHYSSGMYLRLAFAVAAHLEPEILFVDEVLAVGDAAFQKKCLGKMSEVSRQGRTIAFVSHNLAAVRSLCSRGLVMEHGTLAFDGDVSAAIHYYNQSMTVREEEEAVASHQAIAFGAVRIGADGSGTIQYNAPFAATCRLHVQTPPPAGFKLVCIILDSDNEIMVHARTDNRELPVLDVPGVYDLSLSFPALWLRPGVYSLHFKLMGRSLSEGTGRYLSDTVMLDVAGELPSEMLRGTITPDVRWQVQAESRPAPKPVYSLRGREGQADPNGTRDRGSARVS